MLFFPVRHRVGEAFAPASLAKMLVSSLLLFSATCIVQAQNNPKEAEVEKVFNGRSRPHPVVYVPFRKTEKSY